MSGATSAPLVLCATAAYQESDVALYGRQVDRPQKRQGLLICCKRETTDGVGTNSTDLGDYLILF